MRWAQKKLGVAFRRDGVREAVSKSSHRSSDEMKLSDGFANLKAHLSLERTHCCRRADHFKVRGSVREEAGSGRGTSELEREQVERSSHQKVKEV